MRLPISAVIIAKNEADRIAKAVQSVQFCEEIIVVDSFSVDETMAISKSLGARVIQQEFLGYGAQKNFGFSQATQEWILSLDADEVVSVTLAEEIKTIFSVQPQYSSYFLRRKNFFLGQELKFGREAKDLLIRLFKKKVGVYSDAIVHEVMQVQGESGKLKEPLNHFTYRSLQHAQEKMQKYAALGATQLKEKGRSRALWLIQLLHPFYFIKHYLFYGNIWNGKVGWQWSKLMAGYHTLKYKTLSQNYNKVKDV